MNEIKNIPFNKRTLSKSRLNRMCKYFKNKSVSISYSYNNSLDIHYIREYKGKYTSFIIEELEYNSGFDKFYRIIFYKKRKEIFVQEFSSGACCEFYGVGKIKEINGGPYCYFQIIERCNILNKLKRSY